MWSKQCFFVNCWRQTNGCRPRAAGQALLDDEDDMRELRDSIKVSNRIYL